MEDNASHDDVSKVKQSALSALEKNSPPFFPQPIYIFLGYPSSMRANVLYGKFQKDLTFFMLSAACLFTV